MHISNIEGGNNALSRINDICNDLKSCISVITRINNGTYAENQDPIEFNVTTVPELGECMDLLKDRVNGLYKAATASIKDVRPTDIKEEVAAEEDIEEEVITEKIHNEDEESTECEIPDESAESNETKDFMDNDVYENLKMAKHVLCDYCGNEHTEECDDCKVLKLINTAEKSMTPHGQSQV